MAAPSYGAYNESNNGRPHSIGINGYNTSGPMSFGSQANPWQEYFGQPQGELKLNPYDAFARENLALPDAYKGSSPYMTSIIINMVSDADMWPAKIALPYRFTESEMEIVWDELVFNNHLLGPVPEEGVSRLITQQSSERRDHYTRYGLAFLLEHGFMHDRPKSIESPRIDREAIETMDYGPSIKRQLNRYYLKFPSATRLKKKVLTRIVNACNTPEYWLKDPFDDTQEVNIVAGQVRSLRKRKKLLASFRRRGYVYCGHQSKISRARIILRTATGREAIQDETPDHIKSFRKYDDRIRNLRWANKKKQRENQERPANYKLDNMLEISKNQFVTGELITVADAMLRFEISRDQVTNALGAWRNRRHSYRGYQWRYYNPDDEVWVPLTTMYGENVVPGYEVSSMGRLKSPFNHRPTCGTLPSDGYYQASIQFSNGKTKCPRMHVLVCIGFHGDRPSDDLEVDHIDRNPKNNNPSNLRWATRTEQNLNRDLTNVIYHHN